jgi:hypothetical protein
MYCIYSLNHTSQKTYLTDLDGERVIYTKELAEQQLEIFEQLPYKSLYVTWHMIKYS